VQSAEQPERPIGRKRGLQGGASEEALKDFFAAIDHASAVEHGFRRIHVMAVPWAWRIARYRAKRYGWVVQLWDGRRVYLTYSVGRAENDRAKITVQPMPAFEIKPELSIRGIHWFDPKELNTALKCDDIRLGEDRKASARAS
jgi:hypothetical protein